MQVALGICDLDTGSGEMLVDQVIQVASESARAVTHFTAPGNDLEIDGAIAKFLQERGRLMVAHGDEVYEGQIVGIHSRDNDLVVNPLKAKKLTNIRAAGRDENIILSNPVRMTLEQAMEFIDDDELV